MKKIKFLGVVVVAAVFSLNSCSDRIGNETPSTTTTQLWPAYSSSADLYGYINKNGEWVIPAQFSAASSFYSSGYAQVQIDGRTVFIDKQGKVQNTASIDSSRPFYYGYAVASLNGNYGLINTDFSYVIPPVYGYLSDMSKDGLVVYRAASGVYGYMNTKGNVLTKNGDPVYYEEANEFVDGYAVVCSDKSTLNRRIPTYALIDTKGEEVIADGRYMFMKNMGKGIIAVVDYSQYAESPYEWYLYSVKDKKTLSGRYYNSVNPFSNDGVAVVGISEKTGTYTSTWSYGYIDTEGVQAITVRYDGANVSSDGFAWVVRDDEYTLLDVKTGSSVLQLQYASGYVAEVPLCGVHNGLTLIRKRNYYTNETVVSYRWVDVTDNNKIVFSWTVENDKNRGFMNPSWAPARKPQSESEISEYIYLH
ncbi:MAG: WG repeat-containing protein [Paludibacteraceae bacterium]|nr:WG repeat-containing protein [Paludibacteraceae bacterium]